jgi:hypothetical protein
MLNTSENTISETIDVSIYVDTKKDASMAVVWGDYLTTIAVAIGRGKDEEE